MGTRRMQVGVGGRAPAAWERTAGLFVYHVTWTCVWAFCMNRCVSPRKCAHAHAHARVHRCTQAKTCMKQILNLRAFIHRCAVCPCRGDDDVDSVSNGEWTWPVETVKAPTSVRKIKGGRGGARKRTCPECQYIAHVEPVSFLHCQGRLLCGHALRRPPHAHVRTHTRACMHARTQARSMRARIHTRARAHTHTHTHTHTGDGAFRGDGCSCGRGEKEKARHKVQDQVHHQV